ncbi:unnamed protein product [Parajaminaea phylloscopi]
MASSAYAVVLASDAHQLREAYRIRMEVFHHEQGFPADTEVDDYDPISAHFLLVDESESSSDAADTVGAALSGSGHTASTGDASEVASGSKGQKVMGTLRWVPYPPQKTPAVIEDAGSGSQSSLLPLGRPPTSQGALAATFASAGGAKLGRLALDKSARGKKLGARLVRESEEWVVKALQERARAQGAGNSGADADADAGVDAAAKEVTFRLHSQMQVIGFYEALGYHTSGEPFDEDGAPHLLCVKTVTIR